VSANLNRSRFCLSSRLNAMLQMMLNATALRSHDASNIATTLCRGCTISSTNARALLTAFPALSLPSANAKLRP
jgi:hypothetical protein